MKQKERRHLKENEIAHSITAARDFLGTRRPSTAYLVVAVIVAVAVLGFVIVRQQTNSRAHDLLAEAMVVVDALVQPPSPAMPPANGKPGTMATQQPGTYPTVEAKLKAALPKLQVAADAYPNSQTGITARYHLASTLAGVGRHTEALAAYDDLIARAGESMYGRMARLGKANEQARMGEYQPAIATYKTLIDQKESVLPEDAILMQLATAYEASGNKDEAKKTFSRIVHEHPASPYSSAAGKQLQ